MPLGNVIDNTGNAILTEVVDKPVSVNENIQTEQVSNGHSTDALGDMEKPKMGAANNTAKGELLMHTPEFEVFRGMMAELIALTAGSPEHAIFREIESHLRSNVTASDFKKVLEELPALMGVRFPEIGLMIKALTEGDDSAELAKANLQEQFTAKFKDATKDNVITNNEVLDLIEFLTTQGSKISDPSFQAYKDNIMSAFLGAAANAFQGAGVISGVYAAIANKDISADTGVGGEMGGELAEGKIRDLPEFQILKEMVAKLLNAGVENGDRYAQEYFSKIYNLMMAEDGGKSVANLEVHLQHVPPLFYRNYPEIGLIAKALRKGDDTTELAKAALQEEVSKMYTNALRNGEISDAEAGEIFSFLATAGSSIDDLEFQAYKNQLMQSLQRAANDGFGETFATLEVFASIAHKRDGANRNHTVNAHNPANVAFGQQAFGQQAFDASPADASPADVSSPNNPFAGEEYSYDSAVRLGTTFDPFLMFRHTVLGKPLDLEEEEEDDDEA